MGLPDVLGHLHQLGDDLLVGDEAVDVAVHQLFHPLGELLGFDHIGTAIQGHLFRQQLFQQLHGQIFLLHPGHFLQKFGVKEGEFRVRIGKQVDDSLTLDGVLQQLVDAGVDLLQRVFLALAPHGQAHQHGAHRLKIGGLGAVVALH